MLVSPEIRRKKLRLRWTNETNGDMELPATLVRPVVLNLLLNACQATPIGGEITFSATSDGLHLVITVADEGSGLPLSGKLVLEGAPSRQRTDGGGLACGWSGVFSTRQVVTSRSPHHHAAPESKSLSP